MSHLRLLEQGKISFGEYEELERLKGANPKLYREFEVAFAKRPKNYVMARRGRVGYRRAFGVRKDGRSYPKKGFVQDLAKVREIDSAIAKLREMEEEPKLTRYHQVFVTHRKDGVEWEQDYGTAERDFDMAMATARKAKQDYPESKVGIRDLELQTSYLDKGHAGLTRKEEDEEER